MLPLDVISPDPLFRHAFNEQLIKNAWNDNKEFSEFSNLANALGIWGERCPCLIIVDTSALDRDAESFFKYLEKVDVQVVVFFVGEIQYNLGHIKTVETFSKPVRLGSLLSRWQFYRHLWSKKKDIPLVLGPWVFAPQLREIQRIDTGERVRLTDKETHLLEFLYYAQEPLLREEILGAVWGYDGSMDTHTLETHITRLRRKLESSKGKTLENFLLVERGRYGINPIWIKKDG